MKKLLLAVLEHFHQSCSDERNLAESGLFGFWLRFSSVTGFFKPAPSPKPRQKPKILAAHRYTFSVNALAGFALSMFIVAAASAGPVLQMRLADETASDGAEKMSYVTHHEQNVVTNVLYVQKAVLLDESMLKSAKAGTNSFGSPKITLTFNEAGEKRFAEITRQNIDKKLAIIINGDIYQAPIIRTEISGGQAVITGSFSKEETEVLVKKLNEAARRSRITGIEG